MHVYLPMGARHAQVPFCSQGRGAQTGEDCTELVGAGPPTQVLAMSWPSFCLQQALREAQDDLEVTQRILEEAKHHLREVEDGIATMQAKYRECVAKKEELEMKCEQCEQRLSRADKVRAPHPQSPGVGQLGRGGLGDEEQLWVGSPHPLFSNLWVGSQRAEIAPGPSPASQSPLHKAASTAHQRASRGKGSLAGDCGESGEHA